MSFSDRPSIARRIVGFHDDDEGHCVAELECGHAQHVRHEPPLVSRPWVLTADGRTSMLGNELGCVLCADERAADEGDTAHPSGAYSQAAAFYDLLYSSIKDYDAESAVVAGLIRDVLPGAQRVLDVACGTGKHAERLTALGFAVDGVDLEPQFVAIAAARCPEGSFTVGDMTRLALPRRYHAIICMFSAIGYARTPARLEQTLARMAAHLEPGGIVIIDPWFEPGQLSDRWIAMVTGESDGTTVCRMSRTLIDGTVSQLEFEYLIGRPDGIERRSERHELGLFTKDHMESAFQLAGLSVEWRDATLGRRGVYLGRLPNAADV